MSTDFYFFARKFTSYPPRPVTCLNKNQLLTSTSKKKKKKKNSQDNWLQSMVT